MTDRVLSVDNFLTTGYKALTAGQTEVQGATVKFTIAAQAPDVDGLTAIFVTPAILASEEIATQYPTIDWALAKAIAKAEGFTGAEKPITVVDKAGKAVIIVGVGENPTLASIRSAAQAIGCKAVSTKRDNVVVYVPSDLKATEIEATKLGYGKGVRGTDKTKATVPVITQCQLVDTIVRGMLYNNWSHDLFTKKKAHVVGNFTLVGEKICIDVVSKAVHGAESVSFARELGSLRFATATNTYMKDVVEKLAHNNKDVFKIKVMDRKALLAEEYNLISAVNQGSWDQCYLVAVEYTPEGFDETNTEMAQPYSFVAKTLTFDTGGLDLKPPAGMLDMHCDKHAGCNQLGLFRYLALTRPKTDRKVVGVWAITDNEIGSKAVHPHTIISTTSVHGHNLSVAIDNTDAEGRLALADAVTFVQKYYNPMRIVTSATLTGAVLMSLGHYMTGLFTNAPYLVNDITTMGQRNGEPFWLLPMVSENYKDISGSDCDLKNITGGRWMGSSVAATFIDSFVGDNVEFVHWDIAGTSSKPGNEAAGTPTFTMQEYVNSFVAQ